MELQDFFGLAAAPVIIGLLAYLKAEWPEVPTRWYPVFAFMVALSINESIALTTGLDPLLAALLALVTSLLASGFYSRRSTGVTPASETAWRGTDWSCRIRQLASRSRITGRRRPLRHLAERFHRLTVWQLMRMPAGRSASGFQGTTTTIWHRCACASIAIRSDSMAATSALSSRSVLVLILAQAPYPLAAHLRSSPTIAAHFAQHRSSSSCTSGRGGYQSMYIVLHSAQPDLNHFASPGFARTCNCFAPNGHAHRAGARSTFTTTLPSTHSELTLPRSVGKP